LLLLLRRDMPVTERFERVGYGCAGLERAIERRGISTSKPVTEVTKGIEASLSLSDPAARAESTWVSSVRPLNRVAA